MRVGRQTIVVLLALLAAACGKEGKTQTLRPETPKTKKLPSSPPLPKVVAPDPVAAERVVDLFYTSNVAGDADPCG